MQSFRRGIVAIVLTVGLVLGIAPYAQAQSAVLTDEQRDRITTNCVQIKNSLSQLHASDALLRVNRGQVYESLATRLMERFNTRLTSNRLDAKAMNTVTSSYRTTLTAFREHYIQYEQKVSEALRTDCTSDPQKFHNTIESARSLRSQVHDDVTQLHQYIDDYRQTVDDFLLNYERVSQ